MEEEKEEKEEELAPPVNAAVPLLHPQEAEEGGGLARHVQLGARDRAAVLGTTSVVNRHHYTVDSKRLI